MRQPRQPAIETVKRIFDLLICAPSYPTEIHNKTGLHGDTINDALSFLLHSGLVSKERNGQRFCIAYLLRIMAGIFRGLSWCAQKKNLQSLKKREDK
jgi:hypothetical protein